MCGDDWEESEAAIACRQLGFVGEGMIYIMHNTYGYVLF